MAAALAKVLRSRRSGASSQLLLQAASRLIPLEGGVLPHVGSSPAAPAAGMGRLMHTWRSGVWGSINLAEQKALPFGRRGALCLEQKFARMGQFSKRSVSGKGSDLPRVSLPALRSLKGLKDEYMSAPGTHEVFGSKSFMLHLYYKIEKIAKEKASYHTWGFPALLASILLFCAGVIYHGWEEKQTHKIAIADIKESTGKVVTDIHNLGVLIDDMEMVSYLEANEGKRA